MLEKRTGVGVKMLDVSADMEERMKENVLNPRVHRQAFIDIKRVKNDNGSARDLINNLHSPACSYKNLEV